MKVLENGKNNWYECNSCTRRFSEIRYTDYKEFNYVYTGKIVSDMFLALEMEEFIDMMIERYTDYT